MRAAEQASPARPDHHVREALLKIEINRWRATPKMIMDGLGPRGSRQLLTSPTQQIDCIARHSEAHRGPTSDIVDDPEDAHDRSGQDRDVASLVIEADVAAGHRRAEFATAVN